MVYVCLLGYKIPEGTENRKGCCPGECRLCGWEAEEDEKRRRQMRAGKFIKEHGLLHMTKRRNPCTAFAVIKAAEEKRKEKKKAAYEKIFCGAGNEKSAVEGSGDVI